MNIDGNVHKGKVCYHLGRSYINDQNTNALVPTACNPVTYLITFHYYSDYIFAMHVGEACVRYAHVDYL